ncbi:MAG: filamentous hemagglutinin N-terminal domain-containing protein [Nitrospira sp.]
MLGLMWVVAVLSLPLAQGATLITSTSGAGDLGTTVRADGTTVQITGGTRPSNSANLFHSFDQFIIGVGDVALFLNTTPSLPTNNILSRVTGGSPTSIFGTIDTSSYPAANLFFMNPAGIVFGPNATLNVSGSVAFTTANYLRLAEANGSNSGIFHADTTVPSVLTSAPIAAFGFLHPDPSAIAIEGSTFRMQPGRSIFLVGGDHRFMYTNPNTGGRVSTPNGVTVTGGNFLAPGGQIRIASVTSSGEAIAGSLDAASNINGQSSTALGEVQISQQSTFNTIGTGGGTIFIRGGHLVIDSSKIFSNTGDISLDSTSIRIANATQIGTGTETKANAGHITLNASGNIDIDSSVFVGSLSGTSTGNAGNIAINSSHGNLNLSRKATITSQTDTGSGNSGSIIIGAPRGTILLTERSSIFNHAAGTGALGEILINAHNLQLNTVSKIGGDNFSKPVAGNIMINLDGNLTIAGGSFINTEAFASANSANLIIKSPSILITGKDSSGSVKSGFYTNTFSSGDGGHLLLFTDNLQLADGGTLSSKSSIGPEGTIPSGRGGDISLEGYKNPSTSITIDRAGSGIFTSAEGIGPAGNIDVRATSLTIQNGGTISANTTGTDKLATGGSIIINAKDQVALTNDASITASSTGPADAGNVSINAGQQLNIENSKITTEANQSKAGDINIQAIDQVRVVNGDISTSVHSGAGRGGNITIDPKTVILQDGSKVFAQAVQGSGGNITITTPLYLKDATSRVNADSQFGLNGSVTIQSPTSNLSGTVGQLASKTSPPQVLLQNRCVALAGGEQSTFILAGRDALPSEPGGWLSSPVGMDHWTGEGTEDHASGLLVQRKPPSGSPVLATLHDKPPTLSLRRLTPHGFLVRAFAAGTTGCPS